MGSQLTQFGYALSEDRAAQRQLDDAAVLLVALTCALQDYYHDAFDAALIDLLRVTKGDLSALGQVRRYVAEELSHPHDPQWKVSATEYERRKRQILQALRAQTCEAVTISMSHNQAPG
ncbi:MAG: hypothetical protein CVU18_17070 [Betaproteobacteria bacterium HGW-Betaproteobacteria-12]|jgi:hypothetical protein|nr:MAG: hypothetical protein CVU18_17070 [Betaproteobacteria bacterium HGW-Betaproteobacteria-12]